MKQKVYFLESAILQDVAECYHSIFSPNGTKLSDDQMKRLKCSLEKFYEIKSTLLKVLNDERRGCNIEIRNLLGRKVLDVLNGTHSVSILEYIEVCENVIDELKKLSGGNIGALSANLNNVSFYLQQMLSVDKQVFGYLENKDKLEKNECE